MKRKKIQLTLGLAHCHQRKHHLCELDHIPVEKIIKKIFYFNTPQCVRKDIKKNNLCLALFTPEDGSVDTPKVAISLTNSPLRLKKPVFLVLIIN